MNQKIKWSFMISLMIILSCKKNAANEVKKQEYSINQAINSDLQKSALHITFDDISIKIKDVDPQDFNVVIKKDSAYIYKDSYGSIESKSIIIEGSFEDLKIYQDYKVGFKQNVVVEKSGFDLNFYLSKKSEQNGNEFNFVHTENINNELSKEEFNNLREISLKKQLSFYNQLLINKNEYLTCCPEYIEYATKFIEEKNERYLDINELKIYPFIFHNTITITYLNGQNVKKKIIVYAESN